MAKPFASPAADTIDAMSELDDWTIPIVVGTMCLILSLWLATTDFDD